MRERENALLYIYSVIIIGQYLLICETSGYVWTLKDYIGLNFFLFFLYLSVSCMKLRLCQACVCVFLFIL